MVETAGSHGEGAADKPQPSSGVLRDGAVSLRPIGLDDIELLRRWRSRDDIRFWFGDQNQIDAEAQRRWFGRYAQTPNDVMFIIELDARPVGAVALYAIDRAMRRAEYGRLMIGEPDARGKRVADRASHLLCRWGFDELGLELIDLWVRDDNEPAIHLYRRMGFAETPPSAARPGFLYMQLLPSEG